MHTIIIDQFSFDCIYHFFIIQLAARVVFLLSAH